MKRQAFAKAPSVIRPSSKQNKRTSLFFCVHTQLRGSTLQFSISLRYPNHLCTTHASSTINGCIVTPARLDIMLTNHVGTSLFLLIFCLYLDCPSLVSGRVLSRPSVSTLLPFNTDSTNMHPSSSITATTNPERQMQLPQTKSTMTSFPSSRRSAFNAVPANNHSRRQTPNSLPQPPKDAVCCT